MEAAVHKPGASDTHQRLIEAAARVFSRCGLEGATTREIAREAGVNEVTLFRHFQAKDKLLSAVLQQTFDQTEPGMGKGEEEDLRNAGDLRRKLRRYVGKYEAMLQRNILLLRTLIGEIHRYEEHEMRVLKGIFAPLKVDLLTALHTARERGIVRAEIDPLIAADLLWSMVFMEVLRRTSPMVPDYPAERYVEHALDTFVRGIAAGETGAKVGTGTLPEDGLPGDSLPEGALVASRGAQEDGNRPVEVCSGGGVRPGTERSFDCGLKPFAQDDREKTITRQ